MIPLPSGRTFALTVEVPAAPEDVVAFLADLRRHVGLHPYLVSVREVATGTGADGPWTDWEVLERPPAGRFRYPLRFAARVTRTSATTLHTDVRAPLTRLRTETVATAAPHGTTLAEACAVTAPWPLVRYVADNARRAHERTFALLAGALEQR